MMRKNKILLGALSVVGVIAVLAMVNASKPTTISSDMSTFKVTKGPLTISVIESGTIKAREQIIIKNEVEGRTSLIYLIPEGTRVTKGELLVELDASTLVDEKIDQEIRVQNAEASYINATETLAVTQNQAQSDIELAELTFEFAKQDLKKYIEGEYPTELKKADAEITLAEEELVRARETLKWSTTLHEEKYISQTELQADQLNEKKRALDLELAKNNRNLLMNFTYHRDLAQLQSDVRQAEMALERTNRKAKADVVQAEADWKAKKAEFDRQTAKLKKIEDQILKTKIYAPADGLVIYSTSARRGGYRGSEEPLEEGQEVRERQELIYLPTANASKAEVDLHESNLQKVQLGQSAVITVDALNAQRFPGIVARIAPLPNAQSMWMNPDLKVYTTEINIENNNESLRTGMSCEAEMLVARYQDVLFVPIQAVLRVKGQPTVFVLNGKSFEARTVETGLDNNVMIHIKSGLQEGDIVLLTPPLKEGKSTEAPLTFGPEQTILPPQREPQTDITGATGQTDANSQPRRRQRRNVSGNQTQAVPQPPDGVQGQQGDQTRRRFENMTDEQRAEMRKRFENMSDEEREQMRQRRGRDAGGTQ